MLIIDTFLFMSSVMSHMSDVSVDVVESFDNEELKEEMELGQASEEGRVEREEGRAEIGQTRRRRLCLHHPSCSLCLELDRPQG